MKITIEHPSKEFHEKYKSAMPEGAEVSEIYELDMPWYHKDFLVILWWGLVTKVCETIVPELKKQPNYVRISLGKMRVKTKQTK